MIAKLPLVPFVIINLMRLTACVCMKVNFKSKAIKGFSLLAASHLSRSSRKTSGTRVEQMTTIHAQVFESHGEK